MSFAEGNPKGGYRHNPGDRRKGRPPGHGHNHEHGDAKEEQKPLCPLGEKCLDVLSKSGCLNFHPQWQRLCNFASNCSNVNCKRIHSNSDKTKSFRESPQPEANPVEQHRERPPRGDAQGSTSRSTVDTIADLKQKLAALERKQRIEDFTQKQKLALKEFQERQAAELAEFMKSG